MVNSFRLFCVTVIAALVAAHQPPVTGQGPAPAPIALISVATDGSGGNNVSGMNAFGQAIPPRTRISADGRYVVFESAASNLTCGTSNPWADIFVRDRLLGTTTLASVDSAGTPGNQMSFDPVISGNGRYVAFVSQATNLVDGDTNGFNDIFLRDLHAGTTVRLNVSAAGIQANSVSQAPAISADGTVIAFYSLASNLVAGDLDTSADIFVRDIQAGTIEIASITTDGNHGTCCNAVFPTITDDGRFVAFVSQDRLDPRITAPSQWQEAFIRDRQAGTTTLASLTATGGISNTGVRFAAISGDGRHLAWQSDSSNVVEPDANGFGHDVFVRDLTTGVTTRISVASDGTQGNRDSWMPAISRDGRFIAFHSWANNLVPGDTNTTPVYDVFLRDTQLGTTTRLSVSANGAESDGSSEGPSISADGSLVFFQSTATNLAPDHPNGFADVFLAGPPLPGGATGPTFRFTSATASTAENTNVARIQIVRTGAACAAATVRIAPTGGTATLQADHGAVAATVTFAAGESVRTVDVPIVDDGAPEPDETVILTLSQPQGGPAIGEPSSLTLTILDDDTSSNRPPTAANDTGSTLEDTTTVVTVLANDGDPDGDTVTVTAFTQGTHGTVSPVPAGLAYTPAANFHGIDGFEYTIGDGRGGSATATVSMTVVPVNDAPLAAGDQYPVESGTALIVPPAQGVLVNDTDIDGDPLTAVLVDPPARGTLVLSANGGFTYAPQPGAAGLDSFSYQARDPQGAASGTVVVALTGSTFTATVSTCRPIQVRTVHPTRERRAFMGEPFLGNRRLALIENDTVPCVDVDTMEATRCLFRTGPDLSGLTRLVLSDGDWLEARDGRRYAVVGQPVTRDGTPASGPYIVGTMPAADGSASCIAPIGRDTSGTGASSNLASECTLEIAGAETNRGLNTSDFGPPVPYTLRNYVTRYVGTSSLIHPDGLTPVSVDQVRGVAFYTGAGAAVNDTNGERDPAGIYYGDAAACHIIASNGVEVPAAKRPSTRSFPAPGQVDVTTPLRWLAVNPYVEIANESIADPRPAATPPRASFTAGVGINTLFLDASASEGDIVRYAWGLSWTPAATDAQTIAPTIDLPLVVAGPNPPRTGTVTLTVIARDGQADTATRTVYFRRRIPPIVPAPR